MKKAFCDYCGKEINPSSHAVMVTEIKTAFCVKERSSWTSARDSSFDFCDEKCFGAGMEKWMTKQMDNYRENK
jgi:hypothetical protein